VPAHGLQAWSDPRLALLAEAYKPSPSSGLRAVAAKPDDDGRAVTSPPPPQASLVALPQPLQARILSHLDTRHLMRARAVCKSWNALVGSPALTRQLDLTGLHKRVNDDALRTIAALFGSHLHTLILRNCWLVTDEGVRHILAAAPYLEVRAAPRRPPRRRGPIAQPG